MTNKYIDTQRSRYEHSARVDDHSRRNLHRGWGCGMAMAFGRVIGSCEGPSTSCRRLASRLKKNPNAHFACRTAAFRTAVRKILHGALGMVTIPKANERKRQNGPSSWAARTPQGAERKLRQQAASVNQAAPRSKRLPYRRNRRSGQAPLGHDTGRGGGSEEGSGHLNDEREERAYMAGEALLSFIIQVT